MKCKICGSKAWLNNRWLWAGVAVVVLLTVGGVLIKKAADTRGGGLHTVSKKYTLTAGHYTVGVDLPAGRCDVTAVSGKGRLASSNVYDGGVDELFGFSDNSDPEKYYDAFKGLRLSEGVTLTLTSTLCARLDYAEVASGFSGRTYEESGAITLGEGHHLAGSDFPAGVYRIDTVEGRGTLFSTNMLTGGVNEMFGFDNGYKMFNSQFHNAAFQQGVTLNVGKGLTIRLVPVK